jgi:sulfatase maturation enzyme AslB (radical SAM superfamily)
MWEHVRPLLTHCNVQYHHTASKHRAKCGQQAAHKRSSRVYIVCTVHFQYMNKIGMVYNRSLTSIINHTDVQRSHNEFPLMMATLHAETCVGE